jgi:hypothetical protein
VFKPAVFRHLLGGREGAAAPLLPDASARQDSEGRALLVRRTPPPCPVDTSECWL